MLMKAILICPGERSEVSALSERSPLCNLPILGKALIEYWIERLVYLGAREICVLATDRPEQVRALAGDGARWGIRIEVLPEIREFSVAEVRARYRTSGDGWLAAPGDVTLMDCLPGLARLPLFTSYHDWLSAQQAWMAHAATPERIGVHELKPGIFAGLHARISPKAELHAPCWIGDDVQVEAGAVVGPQAILESRAFVERGAEIIRSVVGADSFVGEGLELHDSIALGSTLVNCKLNSTIKVSDAFLLCSLAAGVSEFKRVGVLSRLAAALAMLATLPLALVPMIRARIRGVRVYRPLLAVRPSASGAAPLPGDTFIYYDFTSIRGWLRRWPQLWSIVRGDLAWIGNRPLHPRQAAQLSNDFERLWLRARPGLLSLADAESVDVSARSDEVRAHASYYAAHAGWRLDWMIFLRALFLFVFGIPYSQARESLIRLRHAAPQHERRKA
jgi:NDP-sugar pyrophosphorylase family protein